MSVRVKRFCLLGRGFPDYDLEKGMEVAVPGGARISEKVFLQEGLCLSRVFKEGKGHLPFGLSSFHQRPQPSLLRRWNPPGLNQSL